MRKGSRVAAFVLSVSVSLSLSACAGRARGGAAPRTGDAALETVRLVFLATTDVHGHLESEAEASPSAPRDARHGAGRGGLPLVAGYVDNVRRANRGRVVLLDAGDAMQGTLVSNLSEGRAVVKAMNRMGYAAAAIGNHEFDYGPVGEDSVATRPGEDPRGALAERVRESAFPWLSANVVREGGDAGDERSGFAVPGARPFTVVTVAGVKVGVVGGTSEDTPQTTTRANLAGLRVLPLAPAIERAAKGAREAGATVVIALVHEGGECASNDGSADLSTCNPRAPVFALARALPPGTVDAIFGGHTHQAVAHVVSGVPVLQAWANARGFSRLDLLVDRRTGRPVAGGAFIHPPEDACATITGGVGPCRDPGLASGGSRRPAYEGRAVAPDAAVAASFGPEVEAAARRRVERIGVTLGEPIHRAYDRESALGDLAADALRLAGHADVGLMNGGGLRADLPRGDLTFGALYEAFPFDNRLATATLTGAALRRLLAKNLPGDKGVLSLSGVIVKAACDKGSLALDLRWPDGRPVADGERFRVATIDFLVRGGDGFVDALGEPIAPEVDGPLLRDLVASALRLRGPTIAGDAALFDAAHPRVALPAKRPFSCHE